MSRVRVLGICLVVCVFGAPTGAQAALPEETVAARQAIFGAKQVKPDGTLRRHRMVFSWVGVASLAVSIQGKVVLLDTFVNGLPPTTCDPDNSQPQDTSQTGYTPVSYDQLTALRPRAIFIGHGHYDHECYTGQIAAMTGAKVVGLPQHCEVARAQAADAGIPDKVRCRKPLAADSGFGKMARLKPIGRRVRVSMLRNLHSGSASAPPMNSAGAEAAMYRFRLGRFSFFWNNSAGPLREHAPALLEKLGRLAPTDVQFEATLGFGNPEQGFRDPADYTEALRVKRLYSLHHDLFQMPALSATLNDQMATELASRGLESIFRPLQDPEDYLRPIAFRPKAERWRD